MRLSELVNEYQRTWSRPSSAEAETHERSRPVVAVPSSPGGVLAGVLGRSGESKGCWHVVQGLSLLDYGERGETSSRGRLGGSKAIRAMARYLACLMRRIRTLARADRAGFTTRGVRSGRHGRPMAARWSSSRISRDARICGKYRPPENFEFSCSNRMVGNRKRSGRRMESGSFSSRIMVGSERRLEAAHESALLKQKAPVRELDTAD